MRGSAQLQGWDGEGVGGRLERQIAEGLTLLEFAAREGAPPASGDGGVLLR